MTSRSANPFIVTMAVLSVTYNAILAFVNAHGITMNFAIVAASEMGILLGCLLFVLKRGLYREDLSILLFMGIAVVFAVYMSIANGTIYIDYFRNVLIICLFAMAGSWVNERTVVLAFYVSCFFVTLFLACEVFNLDLYAAIFKPGLYFEKTRGLKQATYDSRGLFANALGFKGRLSFGVIDHRASSLFLEQVSLANFSGISMIYCIYFWPRMTIATRFIMAAMIAAILLTTASRTMLIFSGICIFGYFVFPYIPKLWNLLMMPLMLFGGLMLVLLYPDAEGDNIQGRVVLTMHHLFSTDVFAMLGFSSRLAMQFADSGYVYIIYASTLPGLFVFWAFVTLYPAGDTAIERRLGHAVAIFLALNLMIGATPVFTSKIAGLLWLLVGHARFSQRGGRVAYTGPVAAALPSLAEGSLI
nr:hypothetical protein [uncultured Gellertiella sp.]